MKVNAWGIIVKNGLLAVRLFNGKLALPGLSVVSRESSKNELHDFIFKEMNVKIKIEDEGWEFDAPETKDIFYVCSILSGVFDLKNVSWFNVKMFKDAALAQVEDDPVITYIINAMKSLERS